MIKWINVNSKNISKIAYNYEINIMYIDFKGSSLDTPYAGITGSLFESFCNAEDIDEYYNTHINGKYERLEIDTENVVNVRL